MLNAPIKSESKAESADVMKHVDEDRKMLIQAVIVRFVSSSPRRSVEADRIGSCRIMKSRKTMKHQPLIQEAITQLSSRFNPKVSDVKKAIDQLLDKEYLERVEGQRDLFSCASSLLLLFVARTDDTRVDLA